MDEKTTEKLLPIDQETGEIDYIKISEDEGKKDKAKILSGSLEDDIKVLHNLNSKENKYDTIIINDRFVCRFSDSFEGDGCYYYCSETYPDASSKMRFSNDISLIAYDKKEGREFYALWTISRDRDLSSLQCSSALYEKDGVHSKRMFSVTSYELKKPEEAGFRAWTLPQKIVKWDYDK